MDAQLRSQNAASTMGKLALTLIVSSAIVGCAGNNSASRVQAPGEPATVLTRTLDAGADALQSRPPVAALSAYLDGFHFYNGNMKAQMEAHHYCSILNEEVIQCVIYDGNVKDAKLMGVEYIISERLFGTLPPTERSMWHSHVHEVKSGQLIAPGIPAPAEHALMEKLVHTYGKTWHTWHTDQDKALPMGMPQLMMGFTADGQANPSMVNQRNERFGVDSAAKKKAREDIPTEAVDPAADAWSRGKVIQIDDPTGTHNSH
jgi:hypothetical protein